MKLAQQIIENERLFHILQMGQDNIIRQLMTVTSDENKVQGKNGTTPKSLIENTEIQTNESNNKEIKRNHAYKLFSLLIESRKSFLFITIFHVSIWAFLTNNNYGPKHLFASF